MQRLSDILVVVEPRCNDNKALDRALEIASRTSAAVHLVACDYVPELADGLFTMKQPIAGGKEACLSQMKLQLKGLAARARKHAIATSTRVVWQRPRFEGILGAADECDADLIVMAASDRSWPERLLLGATDCDLIRRAPQPLWLVRTYGPVAGSDWIVAIDPSRRDEAHADLDSTLLDTGRYLARAFESTLHAFHAVVPLPISAPTGGMGATVPATAGVSAVSRAVPSACKNGLCSLLADYAIPESRMHACIGQATAELQRVTQEVGAALVIAGAVSRGALERLLTSNTAASMLNSLTCDLLVVKPDGFHCH